MSVKDQQTNDSIAVFTDIRDHIKWISEIYNKFTFSPDPTTRLPSVAATQNTPIELRYSPTIPIR